MKKNITINLCGRLYQIDEDAYELLSQYIDALRNYFKKQEGGEEIADDNRTIGSENLDDFLRTYERSSYFRNPKTNIDYEVIKIEGSYKELIAGDI